MSNCRYCDDGMLPEKGLHEVEVYEDDPLVFMPCTAAKHTDEDVARLVDALRQIEWLDGYMYDVPFCNWCDKLKRDGHANNCERQLALAPFVEDEDE